jgi:Domain of unknown function (DUF4210)/Chromosome segregation during meiosis
MAIYYEPDDISPEGPSPDSGINVTGHGHGVSDHNRAWSADANWPDIKQAELPKQRGPRMEVSSRAELIESLKRGESPTWVPNPTLEALRARFNPSEQEEKRPTLPQDEKSPSDPLQRDLQVSPKEDSRSPSRELEPADIERPRSALHSGDFFQKHSGPHILPSQSGTQARLTSPPTDFQPAPLRKPWYAPAVPSFSHHATGPDAQPWPRPVNTRSRAPSLGSSLSSSFVFRAPTSPLVHTATNTDLDFSIGADASRQSSSPERANRRRTLPPDSFHSFQTGSTGVGTTTNFSRPFQSIRRESSLPYQAHQPRRSLTSISTNHLASSPQTPSLPRSRRPSFSSDHSPIQHASMVGSFEESILRGRMSTAPSKPLDFVAQIGVLGRGDCKPNLRCPAHVTVPFPAVFYNYPSIGTRSFSDDSPSPYVGTIDLEHSLKPIEAKRTRRRLRSPAPSVHTIMKDATAPENTHIGLAIDRKKRERQRKRSNSPKGPFGGCYRVPQQGQLQIVIKNPNKTAVKLYLVPYSLDSMEPGTKTFVRQRSFSAGPILEKALTDNPQANLPDPLQHKSILRYLIHLKFCCPSKGRYYLYDNIRVVFANRVPDGKESLRNEVQLPEPRYSSYRPSRDPSIGSAGAKLAAEKASRRRSSGFGLNYASFDAMDGLTFTGPAATLPLNVLRSAPSQAIPFHLPPRFKIPPLEGIQGVGKESPHHDAAVETDTLGQTLQGADPATVDQSEPLDPRARTASPTAGFVPSMSTRSSPVSWRADGLSTTGFSCRRRCGSVSPTPPEFGEGLLSRELRIKDAQDVKNAHA